jgi:hypothetical protein
MPNPQQPELARSRKTPGQDPDAASAVIEGQHGVDVDAPRGPVPPDNQPGHHPPTEQDKPDLDAFAAKLGMPTEPSGGDSTDGAPGPREAGWPGGPVDQPAPARGGRSRGIVAGAAAISAAAGATILARRRRGR